KGLEIGYVLDGDVPPMVRGDSLRIRQVLINLVGNAVKFTERGEIAIRMSFSNHDREGGHLRVEVSDSGIGMDEVTAHHVFESFAQADPSTTRKYGGTGLGLTISKHLVALMRGEIGVNSVPGRGSTFWFTVPVGVVVVASLPAPMTGAALLLSRSQIVRQFVEEALRSEGLACRMTSNGAEALQHLERASELARPFALVVLDSDALRGDAEQVHTLGEKAGAPVLMLDRPQPAGAAAAVGVAVAKPLRQASFLGTVRPLLAGHVPGLPPARTEPLPVGPVAPGRTFRVLVAEDNRINQMVAEAMLTRLGCESYFVANGREAVAAMRAGHFDLVLMDCSMPEMDGYEAARVIRCDETDGHARTPIVAMTANVQTGDEEACLAAGMDDYLAKPVTLVKLRQKLHDWLVAPGPATGDGSG
ncbi:MAG TPA: ATP-binding protein, partial [Moraxellaceae bacterium]|nr:ATP-binding protein [Moraxellaceae bacterium]